MPPLARHQSSSMQLAQSKQALGEPSRADFKVYSEAYPLQQSKDVPFSGIVYFLRKRCPASTEIA
jgi:hypothetical protein